jgi:hypothetical protein
MDFILKTIACIVGATWTYTGPVCETGLAKTKLFTIDKEAVGSDFNGLFNFANHAYGAEAAW